MRKVLASNWTAAALGTAIIVLHVVWLSRTAYKADVISGVGVALADLGVLVTAQLSLSPWRHSDRSPAVQPDVRGEAEGAA